MTIFSDDVITLAQQQRWFRPEQFWSSASLVLRDLPAQPTAALHLDALSANMMDMVRRSTKPIRLASKSIRSRGILKEVIAQEGYRGVLAFSLPEAIWLVESDSEVFDDIVVAYPTVDTAAIEQLSKSELLATRITLMVDSVDHLDLIRSAQLGEEQIRVCIDMDMSYRSRLFGHIGVHRSPLHDPKDVRTFAEQVLRQPDLLLVGLMGYEAQIAGLGDDPTALGLFAGLETRLIARLQKASRQDLQDRRGEAVGYLQDLVELEFVNGGGTGSIESTVADPAVTEVAAGSGLFGSHLFDHYRAFTPAPAAAFALPVTRRPRADTVTLFGGGWIASGPVAKSRQPQIAWPEGLNLIEREGAGEVQTPMQGQSTSLKLGDWVWFRHSKAGELSEHANTLELLLADEHRGSVLTYRGEGKVFV